MEAASEDKVNYLLKFEDMDELTETHFKSIVKLSNNKDAWVRSQAASLLMNFKNSVSKRVLIRLAHDAEEIKSALKILLTKSQSNLNIYIIRGDRKCCIMW